MAVTQFRLTYTPGGSACYDTPQAMFAEQIEKFVSATHTTDTNPPVYLTQPPGGGITEGIWKVRDAHGAIIGDFAWSTDHKAWICPYDPAGTLDNPDGTSTVRARTVATAAQIKMLGRHTEGPLRETVSAPDDVGLATGPFWEIDHDFDGRMAVSPGMVPGAAVDDEVMQGTDHGAGEIVLAWEQMPHHAHVANAWTSFGGVTVQAQMLLDLEGFKDRDSYDGIHTVTQAGNGVAHDLVLANVTKWGQTLDVVKVDDSNRDVTNVPLAPAARGVYMIKRTARKYLVATPV